MTQQQIQQHFQLRYNQNNWKQFLSQTFSDARLLSTPDILTGINTNVATQVLRLGYIALYEDGIERNIAIYDVTLAPGIILERNRVGLRNLLRKYWKDIDAAFIVYHRPENPNWRFTYVSELTGFDAEGELIKVKTESKRYTYILGEGESCRTVAERFGIITKKGNKTTLDDVKDAFSVEKLSKSFFDEYKRHYELFCEFMVVKPNIRQTIFNGDEKAIRDFNKKLLGRIVFLYFIQKKGWMGVPENSAWGQGDPNFLWNLFSNSRNKGLFYSEYLSRIFFDTLNTPRPNDIIELINGEKIKIPFLNGGLFEEDNKNYRNLIFPSEFFENLFQFFNQYNFTIYEDDPNDHTVAVDPEMLGHIFENLLEDNKDKGAYYTPKEIVHYMCQESLIEYLCTTLEIEDEAKEKEAVTALLKQKEIDDILKPEIQNITNALDNVKICDPAIGSGAFPMGLLKEIFSVKQTLYTFENGNTQGFDASGVKLSIIQNSIYGVDIEKGAVDIARLRFWLSLVVDEEAPKALPNLDYKIVAGNSLVSKLGDDIIDIDWDIDYGKNRDESLVRKMKLLFKNLSDKQKDFFKSPDKSGLKNEIKNLKIDILINQLSFSKELYANQNVIKNDMGFGLTSVEIKNNLKIELQLKQFNYQLKQLKYLKTQPNIALSFFDWKLDFPEVMNGQVTENVGFHIVIGNPPYGAKFSESDKIYFKNRFKHKDSETESYILFLELCGKLQNLSGSLWFIIPSNISTNSSYHSIRKNILDNYDIFMIIDLGSNIFESASVDSCIFSFRQSQSKTTPLRCGKITSRELSEHILKEFEQKYFLTTPQNIFNFYIDTNTSKIIDKIQSVSSRNLSDYINFSRGIEFGYSSDHVFETPDGNRKPLIAGRCFNRYQFNFENKFVEVDFSDTSNFKTKGIYENPKIFVRRIGKEIVAYLDTENYYNVCDVYNLLPKSNETNLYEILGVINSKAINYYFSNFFKNAKELFPKIPIKYLKQVPIKLTDNKIGEIAKKIQEEKARSKDTGSIEQQIDNLVYRLYELSYEEVKIIDPDFELSEQEYEAIKL